MTFNTSATTERNATHRYRNYSENPDNTYSFFEGGTMMDILWLVDPAYMHSKLVNWLRTLGG